MIFRTISTALLAGFLAAVCLFVIQRSSTLPLIHAAERYEKAESVESPYDPFAKEPMRSISTFLGDMLAAIGFGLILTAVYAISGRDGWLYGLLWGLAGFAIFHLGPATAVPPAVPGMEVTPLVSRQTGWLVAAASTGVGIALILGLRGLAKITGILFLALPAVLFKMFLPIPPAATSTHSLAALDQVFVLETLGQMLVFWLILGTVSGYLFARGEPRDTRFQNSNTDALIV
jgi:cobalt transporter subunit CbtA